MSSKGSTHDGFVQLAQYLYSQLPQDYLLGVNCEGEQTHFIRCTQGKIRQATQVQQFDISLKLQWNKRQISRTFPMVFQSEQIDSYLIAFKNHLNKMIEDIQTLAEDPFIVPIALAGTLSIKSQSDIPAIETLSSEILSPAGESDIAGQLVCGKTYRGTNNCLGQSHWFENESFYFDYSIYTKKEQAVKGLYGGTHFNQKDYQTNLQQSQDFLAKMDQENINIKPGQYRCYFAPDAVAELFSLFTWGGLSAEAYYRGDSPLKDLADKKKILSPLLTIKENFNLGLMPLFNSLGEVSEPELTLIEKGNLNQFLTSTRTATEYKAESNFADINETPRSAQILTGHLKKEQILSTLGTGLYISNLHYLNWSDRAKGRMTGMTRFACFWVENGEIKAPITDLRFDETLYRFWGTELEQITDFSEIRLSTDTYGSRSIGGTQTPGMIINNFSFTL
jgi:predicted Zn-dependent protease